MYCVWKTLDYYLIQIINKWRSTLLIVNDILKLNNSGETLVVGNKEGSCYRHLHPPHTALGNIVLKVKPLLKREMWTIGG